MNVLVEHEKLRQCQELLDVQKTLRAEMDSDSHLRAGKTGSEETFICHLTS